MTPLGFISLVDAVTRCGETWNVGLAEAWAKLRPWLAAGRLDSCAIGSDGQTFSAGNEWAAARNDEALKTGVLLYPSLYDDTLIEKRAFVSDEDLDALLAGRLPTSDARYRANTAAPGGYLSVRDAVTRCRDVWGGTFEDVWDKLLPLIAARRIGTLEIDDNGTRFSDPDLWNASRNREAYILGKLIYVLGSIENRRDGYLKEADLESLLLGKPESIHDQGASTSEPNASATASSEAAAVKNKGGAPPKYHLDRFLIEAFRIIYESSPPPRNQADLRRRALLAYSNRYVQAPSDDWARDPIKLLWHELNLGG